MASDDEEWCHSDNEGDETTCYVHTKGIEMRIDCPTDGESLNILCIDVPSSLQSAVVSHTRLSWRSVHNGRLY